MAQAFKIDGLKELDRLLTELPKATARNVLLRTLKKEGQPMADAESALAPHGATGQLAESPAVSTKLTRRQRKLNPKQSDVEVYVGPTPHPKSVQTEFGNRHQAAEPHLRPAFDGTVMRVLDGIRDTLTSEIDKAVKRLAKKAQREAAKFAAGR